ncbi:MAG: hypothetical protein LBD42_01185 [Desulfovibrio sp.]|jgi:hypothetical protein|nr:hypothetical protein [Desulfovibrio sp.]
MPTLNTERVVLEQVAALSPQYRVFFRMAAACALTLCFACAGTRMDRLMPHVETLRLAEHYFGKPTGVSELAGGDCRYEWLLDQMTQIPGQDVREKILMGYDRSGFPVYYIRTFFVPAHMARQYCRLTIVADRNGRTLASSWEGDGCDEMMIVPSTY